MMTAVAAAPSLKVNKVRTMRELDADLATSTGILNEVCVSARAGLSNRTTEFNNMNPSNPFAFSPNGAHLLLLHSHRPCYTVSTYPTCLRWRCVRLTKFMKRTDAGNGTLFLPS